MVGKFKNKIYIHLIILRQTMNKVISNLVSGAKKGAAATVKKAKSFVVNPRMGMLSMIGAISVYVKMNNEEQDVKKSIMMIVGACIFLIAAAQCLPLFFGL